MEKSSSKSVSWVKWIVVTAVGIALVAAGLWIQWMNVPEIEYYNAYISHYEIPEGIYLLTEEQRKTAADCYRITTKNGRVIRLECVNSMGTLIDPIVPTALTDYPRQDFIKFDEQGRPTEIELYNAQGVLMRRKLLQYQDDTNQIIIDFQLVGTDSNQSMVTQLTSGMNDESVMIIPSHILRQVNTYNEEGLLIRSMFYWDAEGEPAYVYPDIPCGWEFEYTDRGQVAKFYNLDEEGQRDSRYIDSDVQVFTYDETGTVSSVAYRGNIIPWGITYYGYSSTSYLVDSENGNVLQSQRLDKNGAPINDSRGVSRTDYTYDSQGFLVSRKQFDSSEQAVLDSNGCHEYLMTYEPEYGRVDRISCMDVQGEFCANLYGYATVEMTRDRQGNVLEEWLYDAQGKLCQDLELGICGAVHTYNPKGYRESTCYYDEHRQPTLISDGYHGKQMKYDEAGNLSYEAWYNTEGKPVYLDGYAVREMKYNVSGHVIETCFYDEYGVPVLNGKGYHMIQFSYRRDVYNVRKSFFGTDRKPIMNTVGYAGIEGAIGSEEGKSQHFYYGLNDDVIAWGDVGNDGVYRIRWHANDDHGIIFTDMDGNPVLSDSGIHEFREEYDEHGMVTWEASYDVEGNLVCGKWSDYAVGEWEWVYFPDENGYNPRLKSRRVYDENYEPTMCDEGYHELRREYDEKGRMIRECKYDTQGNLLKEKVQNWDNW